MRGNNHSVYAIPPIAHSIDELDNDYIYTYHFYFMLQQENKKGPGSACPLPWTQIEPGHIETNEYHGLKMLVFINEIRQIVTELCKRN